MTSAHEVHAYEYVSRPYDHVSKVLRRDVLGVFQRATASATVRARTLLSTLHAGAGPVELGVDIVVSLASIEEERSLPFGPRTRLGLTWEASQHPQLFPTMNATLDVYALGPGETQVDFHGFYRPPLGVVGAIVDAAIGHRIAQAAGSASTSPVRRAQHDESPVPGQIMTSRHVAVWIDHHEARLFHGTPEGFDESTIHAPHKHIHRHPRGKEGSRSHPEESHRFFHEVTDALEGAEEILVLGPSTAKLEFIRYAQTHAEALCGRIIGIETVDHPTDPRIAAYAMRYFKAADRIR